MSKTKERPPATITTSPARCPGCKAFIPSGSAFCAGDHCAKDDPTVGDPPGSEVPDDTAEPATVAAPAPNPPPLMRYVNIRVPIVDFDPSAPLYLSRHVEIQCTPLEATGLRLLVGGVLELNPKLASGRGLSNNPDAIRWILQEIANSAEETKSGSGPVSGSVQS